MRKEMIVDDVTEDQSDFLRQQYVIKGWRDYAQQRYNFVYANVKFLSKIGQANSVYWEDDELTKTAAQFLLSAQACVMESLAETGSYHLMPLQTIKLWTNGALTQLINSKRDLVERGILNGG